MCASDLEKTALEFVAVYVKETNHNSQTNDKGEYHIYAPMNEFTLVFSMLGYEKAEYKISLGEQRRIFRDVVLKPVTQQLDEVVVPGKSNVQRSND